MKRASRLLLTLPLIAVGLGFAPADVCAAPAPTETKANIQVSFAYFMERLGLFGHWLKHPVFGDVWQPDAGPSFRPYFFGYWEYTQEYGWFWVSNEPYGDIVYHYGRWVFDPVEGWLWAPGYVWGPSWVVWRQGDSDIGWLPMPPGYADFSDSAGIDTSAADGWYGYQNLYGSAFLEQAFFDLWLFVDAQDFARSDRRRYVTDRGALRDRYRHSHDRTGYREEHDRVVDRSIEMEGLFKTIHRAFEAKQARRYLRSGTPVASVSEGREIFRRERAAGGINPPARGVRPRGVLTGPLDGAPSALVVRFRHREIGENGAAPMARRPGERDGGFSDAPPAAGFSSAPHPPMGARASPSSAAPQPLAGGTPAVRSPARFARGPRNAPYTDGSAILPSVPVNAGLSRSPAPAPGAVGARPEHAFRASSFGLQGTAGAQTTAPLMQLSPPQPALAGPQGPVSGISHAMPTATPGEHFTRVRP